MKIRLLLPALFAGAMMFTACSKDDDKPLPPNLGIVQPEAQDKGNGVKEVQDFNAENDGLISHLKAAKPYKWITHAPAVRIGILHSNANI